MPVIKLETEINSTIEICFDLSRSIDGVTTGLINYNESVTWQATHLGIRQKLTTKITAYERPYHFCDEQIKGVFKKIKHDHYFITKDEAVLMTDIFLFEAP